MERVKKKEDIKQSKDRGKRKKRCREASAIWSARARATDDKAQRSMSPLHCKLKLAGLESKNAVIKMAERPAASLAIRMTSGIADSAKLAVLLSHLAPSFLCFFSFPSLSLYLFFLLVTYILWYLVMLMSVLYFRCSIYNNSQRKRLD